VMKNEKGMTLLEVIVVLAVLGALAAMLSPVVFRYIDDANRARSQADARTIATAIQRMYADTGRWPFYADGDGATAYTDGTDAAYLTSGTCAIQTAETDTLGECDGSLTYAVAATGWTAASKADGLVRHLVTNSGGTGNYIATSTFPRAWKGPYTDAIPSVDAWGNPYIVNIGGAASSVDDAVLVVSAGPNGIVETAGNSAPTTNVTAGGDDIIARVK
jgi:prepilin-type N-terminal cleavage/methylation domain-containing protein